MPLTTAPSATVANSSLAIGTGPVSRTRAPYLPGKIEIAGGLPDRVGGVLAGLQRVEIEDRLEFDEGAAIGIGQRLVADEFAPGERRRTGVQHVLHGVGDQRERPRGVVELDLSALDAGKAGFQRAGQSPDAGIAGHDFDQRRGRGELAGHLAELRPRAGTTARFSQRILRIPAPEPKSKCLVSPDNFCCSAALAALVSSGVGAFHHGQDRAVPIECLVELIVALAPIELRRNQGVDVGVDFEVPGCVEAGRNRKDERDQDSRGGKPGTSSNNRYDNTCQHNFSFQ